MRSNINLKLSPYSRVIFLVILILIMSSGSTFALSKSETVSSNIPQTQTCRETGISILSSAAVAGG